ncbi:MAG TPA: LPS export ABC transporter ATP-binding protein [Gemmatimonadaceae bacterium]|nr:LPS export ABC transporter ATP-binding protein [Gemmatimonadaceae bacterium]
MTGPTPSRARELIEELARNDRSLAQAMHSLLAAADGSGRATIDDVAVVYRDDHLAALRAEGKDAEHEAGRLSLDEVRSYLISSVFPRLSAEDVIAMNVGDGVHSTVGFTPRIWSELSPNREGVEAVLRTTAEHPAEAAEGGSEAPEAPPEPSGSILEASGLVKMYRRRKVVNDVALRLQQGEIVGLLGPNGAGKTTTFYMIVGLIQPLSGRILLDGKDITSMPMYKRARQGIGYLSQEPSIFRKLTVEENILAILETLGLPAAERRHRLETLLDELSIKHLRNSKAFALSGGERRRLEITRALVTQPKFMMLDEPFAGVDPIAVHDIQTIVAGLRKRSIGVLISDHNVEQTLDIVDRAYIMFDGRVRVSGTVRELVFDDEVARVYLGPTLAARLRARFTAENPEPAS